MEVDKSWEDIKQELEECHRLQVGLYFCDCHHWHRRSITSHDHCFECIMTQTSGKKRMQTLKNLFNNKRFRNGTNDEWREIQFGTLQQINSMLLNPSVFELKCPDLSHEDFKQLLLDAGLVPMCLHVMGLRTPDDRHSSPVWPAIVFYSMSILGGLQTPKHTKTLCETNHPDRLFVAQITERLVGAGSGDGAGAGVLVQQVVSCLVGAREIVEVIRAVWLLRALCYLSASACKDAVATGDGLQTLVHIATPGKFQKMVMEARDAGLRPYVKYVLLEMRMREQEDPHQVTLDDYLNAEHYKFLMGYSGCLQELASATLSDITTSGHTPVPNVAKTALCRAVHDTPGLINMVLKWLRHPFVLETDRGNANNCLEILRNLCFNKKWARDLVFNDNLILVLSRFLYVPFDWPIDEVLLILHLLMRVDKAMSNLIAKNDEILYATACHIYSGSTNVQDLALILLMTIMTLREDTFCFLHKHGLMLGFMVKHIRESRQCDPDVQLVKKIVLLDEAGRRKYGKAWDKAAQTNAATSGSLADAEHFKERGNESFRAGDYFKAMACYSNGLSAPKASSIMNVLYSNRSECFLRLNKNQEAVRDATLAVGFECNHSLLVKTLFRRAKAFIGINKPFQALGDISYCIELAPSDTRLQEYFKEVLTEYIKLEGVVYHVRECAHCHIKNEGFKKCIGCYEYYCSKTCQKLAWPQHKLICSIKSKCNGNNSPRKSEPHHQSDKSSKKG